LGAFAAGNKWENLFNGKDLAGWKRVNGTAAYTVVKGEIVGTTQVNTSNTFLATTQIFGNFILEADFKITEGANSGIKYFIQDEPGRKNTVGFEFQILDDARHPDAKMGINGNRTLASLYDLIPANSKLIDPNQPVKRVNGIGQWNRARIEVHGNSVAHYLNGVKVLGITKGSKEFKEAIAMSKFSKVPGFGEFEEGHILLQDHGNEVSFRNIKIKEL